METNNYLSPEEMINLDLEWSDFLKYIPDQLGGTIAEVNEIFENKVKRWCVKMSLKYKINLIAIKNRYGTKN